MCNRKLYPFACLLALALLILFASNLTYNGTGWTKHVSEPVPMMHAISGRFTSCSMGKRTKLMKTPLSVNPAGEVDLRELKTSGCFVVKSSKSGINGILEDRTFMDTKCQPVHKRFLNVTGKEVVTALASIPGSGNTWTRHLLEEITGVYTGSVYGNKDLDRFFKGEQTTHNVIAVKTHKDVINGYNRAIVIVRDPFESALAEYNRQRVGQTDVLEESKFKSSDFKRSLQSSLSPTYVTGWINKFKGDLFILYYDKLITDLPNSLIRLVSFLKTETTLERLWCTVANKTGSFKRKEKPKFMSRKMLVSNETETRIQKWKQTIQAALKRRSLHWTSN